jgi:hypothetical protein
VRPEQAAARLSAAALAIVLGGLVLRLAILARPLPVLDNLFFPDDAFISLTAARSIARGLGWTLDGEHFTNGFQPLHVFGLAALTRLTGDALAALRASLALFALCDALATWLIFALVRRATGSPWAGLLGAGLWSFSPGVIANGLCGLETPLIPVGMLLAWGAYRGFVERGGAGRGVVLGLGLGLLMLARVDAVLFAAALGLDYLWRRGGLRRGLPVAAGFLALALPWWGYNLWRFGTMLPESGQAVRLLALWHREQGHLGPFGLVKMGVAELAAVPLPVKPLLKQLGPLSGPLLAAMPLLILLACWQAARADRLSALRPFVIHLGLLLAFYLGYEQAFWFYRRYLHAAFLDWTLVLAFLWARVEGRGPRLTPWLRPAAAALAVLLCLPALRTYLTADVRHSLDSGVEGAKGYYGVALAAAPFIPPGARVGALQSGALAFVLEGRTVVNLDGVVNGDAGRAIREGRLGDYIAAERLDYLADWDLNIRGFLPEFSRRGGGVPPLERVADLPPQGGDTFRLWRVLPQGPGGAEEAQ